MKLQFPFSFSLADPFMYFSLFEIGSEDNKEVISMMFSVSKMRSVSSMLNDDTILIYVFEKVFGIRAIKNNSGMSLDFLTRSIKINQIGLENYIGTVLGRFSNGGSFNIDDDTVVIYSNETVIKSEKMFENSNYINGIYNIICMKAILLANANGMLGTIKE